MRATLRIVILKSFYKDIKYVFLLRDIRLNKRSKITIADSAAKIEIVVDDNLNDENISLKFRITFLNMGSNVNSKFSGRI